MSRKTHSKIINQRGSVSPEMALRLARGRIHKCGVAERRRRADHRHAAWARAIFFAVIDLQIDHVSHDVSSATARLQVTFADSGPGSTPDADAQDLRFIVKVTVVPSKASLPAAMAGRRT